MSKMISDAVPTLYFNTTREDSEDRKAVKELFNARVIFEPKGPIADERTPLLIYSSMKFYGLDGIRLFISNWGKECSESVLKKT